MTTEQKKRCKRIIHTAAASAAGVGAGMAQLPGADVPIIVGIEITMTISLGAVFGISLTETNRCPKVDQIVTKTQFLLSLMLESVIT